MRTRRVNLNELDCFEVSGVLGDTYHIDIPDGITDTQTMRSAMANIVIYANGTVETTFERYPGQRGERSAGASNIHYTWARPNPGRVSYRVTTEIFSYYCIKDKKNRPLAADDFKLTPGASAVIPPNKNLFIASGSVEVEGRKLVAPAQVLTTKNVNVIASSQVFGAVFERLA